MRVFSIFSAQHSISASYPASFTVYGDTLNITQLSSLHISRQYTYVRLRSFQRYPEENPPRVVSLLADLLAACSLVTIWRCLPKLQFTKPSAFPSYCMDVRVGLNIADILRRLKHIIFAAYKISLVIAGGIRKRTQRYVTQPSNLLSISCCRGNSAGPGWGTSYVCPPTDFLVAFCTARCLMDRGRPVGRPELRYSDHIKSVLGKCNIPELDLERLAADMDLRCYRSEELHRSIWASSQRTSSSQTCRRPSNSSWTCLSSMCQHLCIRLWSPQPSS